MSLSTPEEWAELADALARERKAYGTDPGRFPIVLGIAEPDALREWCAVDALDSLEMMEREIPEAQKRVPPEAATTVARGYVASYLATHTQIGVEIGLWLAQTGRVRP